MRSGRLTGEAGRRLHRAIVGHDPRWRQAMKSAYGRQTPPPDYELTCVEQGSPMGELLRRYWQPVCTSDELRDLPKTVKLLCKELVVFRDKKGRVGAVEAQEGQRSIAVHALENLGTSD